MTRDGVQASSTDVLRLVQTALDRFDSEPLDATLRRTIRIASLLGETHAAVRLGLELKPSGGHPPSNGEMTRRLMADPETFQDESGAARLATEEYIAERTNAEDLIVSHSLPEIEFWQVELLGLEATDKTLRSDLAARRKMVEITARARHQAFTYLCKWERQLTFASTQDDVLLAVARRVDVTLSESAPDVVDMFNVAFRRLREAAGRDSGAVAAEELSQALASCRRILKAVVDVVQPPHASRPASDSGHPLTDEHYKNRLVEFLRVGVSSRSFRTALAKEGESLFERFTTLDGLSNKGVHAQVALDEAEFCALNTYALAGEILSLAETRRGS